MRPAGAGTEPIPLPRSRRIRALIAAAAATAVIGSLACAAAASRGTHRFFITPSSIGVSCELSADVADLGTSAYCVSEPPTASSAATVTSVSMTAAGKLKICRGVPCASNAPEHAPLVRIGSSIQVGPFRCTALRAAVLCLVTKLGHGFVIDSAGVIHV